jgi:hypothetical protein
MKEKRLMTSFFVASFTDVALTHYALDTIDGAREIGLMGAGLIEDGRFDDAAMIRIGFVVLMVGMYALNEARETRWAYSFEKSLQISNVIVWSVNAINFAQIMYESAPK